MPEIAAQGRCQDGCRVARLAYKDFGVTPIKSPTKSDSTYVEGLLCRSLPYNKCLPELAKCEAVAWLTGAHYTERAWGVEGGEWG